MTSVPGVRPNDLVLYGAESESGREVFAALARVAAVNPFRWAIAGQCLKTLIALRDAQHAGAPARIYQADPDDNGALAVIATSARLIVSAVEGPPRVGESLLARCIENGSAYVGIADDQAWVERMIVNHAQDAAQSGSRAVVGCALDDVWAVSARLLSDPMRWPSGVWRVPRGASSGGPLSH